NTLVPDLSVKIEPIEIGSYWDLLNPRLAAGEIPDVFHCHNEAMYSNYLAQNVLAGVSPDVIKANMPKYVAGTIDYGAEVWSMVLKDGLVYGLPAMDEAQTRPFTNAWRGDWLKAVGIEKVPTTVEEYEEALTKFTFNDPDKNGVNDTYGTTIRGKDATPNLFPSLFAAYGVFPSQWNMTADGTIKYGIADPRAKDALATLNSWFKKGLIDPEFTAVDGSVRTEKWSNSKVGMMCDSTYYEINEGKAPHDNLLALTPTAEIVRGPAPKGPNGSYGYLNWSKLTNKAVFGKNILNEDGKLEKFLQLWEVVNTDPDTYTHARFGVENESWKRLEDGSVALIPPYNDAANCGKIGINAFGNGLLVSTPATKATTVAKNEAEQYKYAIEGTMVNGKDYFSYLSKFISADVETAYKLEAENIYKKNIIDFITGARPLSEYEKFVEEWNKAGGEAYTKAYNDMYKTVDKTMNDAKELFK
ncbi:MAG: hypothetical protein RR444_09095, partial [Oscillospiraceae bacterium]